MVQVLFLEEHLCKHVYLNLYYHNTDSKLEEGIFVGPEIRKTLRYQQFDKKKDVELAAWSTFERIVSEFLEIKEVGNDKKLVEISI